MQFAYIHKTSIGEEIKGKIAVVAQVVKSRFYPGQFQATFPLIL